MSENGLPMTLALKGGNKYNPSSITKVSEGRFELKYFGVGLNVMMAGSKEDMATYAWSIMSTAKNDLPQQIFWLRSAVKGELYRCKSGAISSQETCVNWQGGVDHQITEQEIADLVQLDLNMFNDTETILQFIE